MSQSPNVREYVLYYRLGAGSDGILKRIVPISQVLNIFPEGIGPNELIIVNDDPNICAYCLYKGAADECTRKMNDSVTLSVQRAVDVLIRRGGPTIDGTVTCPQLRQRIMVYCYNLLRILPLDEQTQPGLIWLRDWLETIYYN